MRYSVPLILSLAFAMSAATTINAQEIRIGGGYSGSNIQKAGTERWAGQAGYEFGADVLFGNRWFIKPGIHFMVRNLNYTVVDTSMSPGAQTNVEFRYTDRWLKVPVLVGVRLLNPEDDHTVNAYLMAGPTAMFKLSADLNNDKLTVTTNPAQWYVGAGAGLEISFLFVEAGYNVAMNNVFKGNDFKTNPKVNQFYATAGVRLKLAK